MSRPHNRCYACGHVWLEERGLVCPMCGVEADPVVQEEVRARTPESWREHDVFVRRCYPSEYPCKAVVYQDWITGTYLVEDCRVAIIDPRRYSYFPYRDGALAAYDQLVMEIRREEARA